MACILLWSSVVRVHDSQAYWKIDVTRERISRILELGEILLSIQIGFGPVNAAFACAILLLLSHWPCSTVTPLHSSAVSETLTYSLHCLWLFLADGAVRVHYNDEIPMFADFSE